MKVRVTILILALLLAVTAITVVSAAAADTTPSPASYVESSSPSPEASPSATPTPPPPASAKVVKHALRQRRGAVRAWGTWNEMRSCFRLGRVSFSKHSVAKPKRSAPDSAWKKAGRSWRIDKRQYRHRTSRLHYAAMHPGGSSNGERWKPLARHVGFPEYALPQLCYIINRESSGRPNAKNSSSTASGLLQFLSSWWAGKFNPFNPEENLRCGARYFNSHHNWQPWAL